MAPCHRGHFSHHGCLRLFLSLLLTRSSRTGYIDVRIPQPKVAEFLLHKLERARGAAVVWVDITDVNVFMQKWTAERFQIVIQDADALLSRCWRLPQRQPRVDAAALAATAYEEESSATMRRNTTMAYRYLHRAVSHFYQRIGNKAVSAFATIVNDKAGLGSLQHVRGTRTKFEVCFEPQEAGALLINDAFITELLYPGGIVRALRVVFSVLCVLHRFSEAAALPARGDVVACLTSHVALVSMKIRAHRKKRAPSELDDGEAVDTTPRLNGGHRAEWVEEMAVVRQRFAPQGARSTNGLRLTDGTEPRRDDPSYREPLASASGAGDRTSAVAAPAVSDGMPSTGADGSPAGDDSGGEELSDADAPGPVDHAAVAAALGAAAHAMAGVYEEVD